MPHRPFLLDDESQFQPSSFVVDFVLNDVRYQYGVSQSTEGVHEEWLYAFPKLIRQVLFARNMDETDGFYFGRSFSGGRQIQSVTPKNALFLSAGHASDHPLLVQIFDFFEKGLNFRMSEPGKASSDIFTRLETDEELAKDVVRYLGLADVVITEMRVKKTEMPEDTTQGGLNRLDEIRTLELGHKTKDGTIKYLDISDESLGTRHLCDILPSVLLALRYGGILVLDEITTSLHTLLARKIVSVFQNQKLNTHGAQLVFSTHDTNLLAPGILRRDQVWFTEKSAAGDTLLFPLTDIKTKNTDNIEKGYIQGRFGAIPFVGNE